jgi:uncharacterized Zn finger protein
MTTKNDVQVVSCENCGSEWKIERFWKDSDIVAILVKCPLCGEKQK